MNEEYYSIPSLKQTTVYLFALFAFFASIVLHFGTMFVMAIALLMLPIISYILGRRAASSVECARELPDYEYVGNTFESKVRLKAKKSALGAVEVDDQLPEWIVSIEDNPSYMEMIEPGYAIITMQLKAIKRGVHELGPLRLTVSDPLGFYEFEVASASRGKITIFPKPLYIPEFYIGVSGHSGEYQYEGTGAKGSGLDFHSVRPYQPGDELRRVHWPSTAKHGDLTVIEFEHTRAEDIVILLDAERGSELGEGLYTTLEYGVSLAAAMAEQSLSLGCSAMLLYQEISEIATRSAGGMEQWYLILDALAHVEAKSSIPLSQLIAENFNEIKQMSSVTCIGSTISKETIDYLGALVEYGVNVHFVLVRLEGTLANEAWNLVNSIIASGITITIIEGSTSSFEGKVVYEYPNSN